MKAECLVCPLQIACGERIREWKEHTLRAETSAMSQLDLNPHIEDEIELIQTEIRNILAQDDYKAEDASRLVFLRGELKKRQELAVSGGELVRINLGATGVFDQNIAALQHYAEMAANRCRKPVTRKRFILFGREIVTCSGARILSYLK